MYYRLFRYFFSLVCILFVIGCRKDSQIESFHIKAEVDTTKATIGDIVSLRIIAEESDGLHLSFPDMEDSEFFEIRQKQYLKKGKGVVFNIVFWDTGRLEIPPYPIEIMKADNTVDYIMETDPFFITVYSTIKNSDGKNLKPIKEPVPVTTPILYRKIILLIAFLLLFGYMVYLWTRRIQIEKRKEIIQNIIPPPYEEALDSLELIKKVCDVKKFYVELSYLLRKYVESSIYIKTLEMTTEEIDSYSSLIQMETYLLKEWIELLKRSDLIKYAKQIPEENKRENDLEWSRQFITLTNNYWRKLQVEMS